MSASPLAAQLTALFTKESVLQSPLLCSMIAYGNCVPLVSIARLPWFRDKAATVQEIWTAADGSVHFQRVVSPQNECFIQLPFSVDVKALVIRTANVASIRRGLSAYVATMIGPVAYDIAVFPKERCCRISFDDARDLIAFWRALPYRPLNGLYLAGEMGLVNQRQGKTSRTKS
jgi:hypothetical protein